MKQPKTLDFVRVESPGEPVRLTWDRPDGAVGGYLVVSTERPFPREMAPEFFAGRMKEHFRETPLGPEVAGYQTDSGAAWYTVLFLDDRGRWVEAAGVRAGPATGDAPLAVEPWEAEQSRSYNRARWSPLPLATDREVALYLRADRPEPESLGAMLGGVIEPEHTLSARCDGFVDTITEPGFRVHYVALVIDKFQHRRPLRLTVGAFQRLEHPAWLNAAGPAKVHALNDQVVAQLATELRRKTLDVQELRPMLARARDLMPISEELDSLEAEARARFPDL